MLHLPAFTDLPSTKGKVMLLLNQSLYQKKSQSSSTAVTTITTATLINSDSMNIYKQVTSSDDCEIKFVQASYLVDEIHESTITFARLQEHKKKLIEFNCMGYQYQANNWLYGTKDVEAMFELGEDVEFS